MFRILTVLFLAAFALPSAAQDLWTDVSSSRLPSRTDVSEYRVVQLDLEALRATLSPSASGRRANTIPVPIPEGGVVDVIVSEASVMAPALQARYPSIRTYTAQGMGLSGRISVTPHGTKGLFFDRDGPIVIEPMGGPADTDVELYAVFRASDMILSDELIESLQDDVVPGLEDAETTLQSRRAHGETLRTYRLAVATEGEYTSRSGGSVELALAAVVTAVNRVNVIYERDMAVTFELIADNDKIIYTDEKSDPFTLNGGDLLGQVQETIDDVIGDANYDVGHLLRFVSNEGGIAALRSACVSSIKAAGWSNVRDQASQFSLFVFPHELGHQLGAPHSYVRFADNNDEGFNPNGFEPGPGFSIMSYPQFAGFRPSAAQYGVFFHGGSLDFMNSHVRGSRGSCGTDTPTNNDIPVVTVPDAFTIPMGSLFTLDGSATDASGTELFYTWEQMDRYGNGLGPVPFFRSLFPTGETARTFPSLDRVFEGNTDIDETVPDREGVYTFQLTVRDNVAGTGAVGEGQVQIQIVDSGELFEITSLGQFVVFEPGETTDLLWNVAGTNSAPINVDAVDILLSIDNGETFEMIAEGVPNDGSQEITLPSAMTEQGRIMVRAVGSRFFAVNEVPFGIGSAPVAGVSVSSIDFTLDPGDTDQTTVSISNDAAASTTLDYTVELQNVELPGGGFAEDTDFLVSTSNDPNGPTAGFRDISDGFKLTFDATLAGVADEDDGVDRLTIPFSFPFYGRTYRSVNVSTNGLLILGSETPHDPTNQVIPSTDTPNGVIAPLWDDLNTEGTNVYAAILPDGRFAVQWDKVSRFDEPAATFTFQVILSQDGTIEFQYGALEGGRLDRATVGVENIDGTSGIQLAFDEPYLTPNSAIRFETPVEWISLRNTNGQLAGGGSRSLEVNVDASEILAGVSLRADVVVRTNDASRAVVVIPVTLQTNGSVAAEGTPEGFTVSLAAPNPTSSRTVVKVALATPSRIQASIHDALGRQVALVYDGEASGALDLEVDASSLAAGVYLVRIAGDGFVETRQLVVAR